MASSLPSPPAVAWEDLANAPEQYLGEPVLVYVQREEPIDHRRAIAMHVAGGGTDLGVGVTVERLLDEVEESGLALQGGQQGHGKRAN